MLFYFILYFIIIIIISLYYYYSGLLYYISIIIDNIHSITTAYITPTPYTTTPLGLSNQSLPLISFRVILSRDSVLFFTCPFYLLFSIFYFFCLFNRLVRFLPSSLKQTTQNNHQLSIHYPDTPNTHTKCVTKSSSDTLSVNAFTSSTPSTLALLMDSAAMEYRKRLCWLVIPVTSTPDAGSILFRLVRGLGLILGMGVTI